jgi:selenocysteine lyase/cysteine desulfurase
MITSQRHLFDIPEDIAYFNCAYMGPLPRTAVQASARGTDAKAHPWRISAADFFTDVERARGLFARLIGAEAEDIAIVPAASYGISVAARNLPVAREQRIVVLAEQFPSNVYTWQQVARQADAELVTVERPDDGDLTEAVLAALDEGTAIAALPNCHWADGALVDLEAVGKRCRELGASLVLDVTQSAGAMPLDVARVQPDFLVAACYKWLLGPYSMGFLYVAPKHQDGEPIEHSWADRLGSEDFARLVAYRDEYQPGARRFDMGERANFLLLPPAMAALEQILEWGVGEITESIAAMNARIAERAAGLGLTAPPDHQRAGHFLGLRFPGGVPEGLLATLTEAGVYVSVRGDSVRITPHLYNNDDDVERLFRALEPAIS